MTKRCGDKKFERTRKVEKNMGKRKNFKKKKRQIDRLRVENGRE